MSDTELSFWRDAYNSAKGKPVQQLIRTAYVHLLWINGA